MDNTKKKLVILSAFYEPYMSGAEQMAREILERLGNKYETILLTGRFDKNLPFIEERKTFKIIRLGIGHKTIDKFLYPILAAFKVQALKPDIVHAIMESYAGGALALVKLFYSKAKRILTLQSGDLDDPSKQGKPHIKLFWKVIHQSPHIVTAISSFLAGRAERLGVKKENIYITPNGVDLSEVPDNIDKIPGRVVFVGRISWEKGTDHIIEAWPMVMKEVPHAKMVFIGPIDERAEEFNDKVQKMIKDLKIGGSVEFAGRMPHSKILTEISKSEIFLCPSLAEGLGVVFIEAQACGVPPIGTRVGGIPDVIQHEKNGLLIEPKNSGQIADAVIRLFKNNDLRERLASNAKESVKRFDWNTVMEKIDSIYNS